MFGKNEIGRSLRIESEIGSGGSGSVYKAWHKRLQKYVVVKEHKHLIKKGPDIRRNELEALKNVKCAYLPQVFDFIAAGKRSYTVMEYIDGESFDRLLKRGKKHNQLQVIKWYGQLASALISIHMQDVCHRDIKPSNVMLTLSGDVCLIDFNAALVRGGNARFTSRSPGYASPEQYDLYERMENSPATRGRRCCSASGSRKRDDAETQMLDGCSITDFAVGGAPQADVQTEEDGRRTSLTKELPTMNNIDWKLSDIYSLGATMYHILTGVQPPGRPPGTVALTGRGAYDEGLAYTIEKSMQIKPSDRFASAAVLADIIRQTEEQNSVYTLIAAGQEFSPALR